jgi:TolB-like protein/Flp pilus assembly protein TadD/DNA-binding winged helix-turn-helix (wHTH) protein
MPDNPAGATDPQSTGYQVDDLSIDLGQRRVVRGSTEIPLPHLSFELLVTLVRAAPNLVTFDQLTERVWPGLVITPETISQRVKLVRDALGDNPQTPRYIAGVRGSGYRLAAGVRPLPERRQPPWPSEELTAPIAAGSESSATTPAVGSARAPDATTAAGKRRSPSNASWLGGFLIVMLLLATPWLFTRYLRAPTAAAGTEAPGTVIVQPPRTIAVLPLVDMSPAGGNAYLGDGLAQELSARLARVRGLRVAARTAAFAFKDRQADARTIGQTLGVRHFLEGSVRREGEHLRVTVQLIDAASGYDVWSQTYDRTWQDLLIIEDDLARSIMRALRVMLSSDAAQRVQYPTTQVAAFDRYLAGLARLHAPASPAQLDEAEQSFRQALAEDPKFALAYAGLCQRYVMGYEKSGDAALVTRAEDACAQALKLDNSLREVTAALGHLYVVSGRHVQAEAMFRSALRADPGDADAYIGLGEALEGQQHTAEAERALRQAVDVEPTYSTAQTALGNLLFRHGRSAAALAVYRRVTELTPASPDAFTNLGAALEMSGDFQGAAGAFQRSLALEPTRGAYSNLGTMYYFLGRYQDAARMFGQAAGIAGQDHRLWGNLADALWQIDSARPQAQADYRRAMTLAQRSLEVNPRDAVTWMQLAYYSARVGDHSQAQRSASRALGLSSDDVFVHYYAALIALERQDAPSALDNLQRALSLGYPVALVRAAPDFTSLRSDARFQRLLAQAQEPQSASPR